MGKENTPMFLSFGLQGSVVPARGEDLKKVVSRV